MIDLQPRNTFVLLRLMMKPADQVGLLTIPTAQDEYTEGKVIAVGPGVVQAAGCRPETFDLEAGQRVLVKYRSRQDRPGNVGGVRTTFVDAGLPLRDPSVKNGILHMFEQGSILGIFPKKESGNQVIDTPKNSIGCQKPEHADLPSLKELPFTPNPTNQIPEYADPRC